MSGTKWRDQPLLGLPKTFHWYGWDTVFFFVSLCVPLWLKLDGGFGINLFFLLFALKFLVYVV